MPPVSQRSAPSLGFRGSRALGGDKRGLDEGGDLSLKGKVIYMSISVLSSDWSRSSLASFSKFAAKNSADVRGTERSASGSGLVLSRFNLTLAFNIQEHSRCISSIMIKI